MAESEAYRDRTVAGGLRRKAGAYAELVRLPNLFTAPPDVVLGAALLAALGEPVSPTAVGALAVASMALYAGGVTLNDAFDAPEDARERPERPIPSGRVGRRTAFGLGGAFLAGGVALALSVGTSSALVAAVLAVAIVLYDGLLKDTVAGFLTMGATRGLNVVLGTTVVAVSLADLPLATIAVPIAVATYIAAVTYMASRETEGGNRTAVAVAAAGAILAVAVLAWYLLALEAGVLEVALSVVLVVAFGWWIGRPLRAAYLDPVPETVGPAVGACVLGLAILEGAFAAATGLVWAVAVVAFVVPATVLSRVFEVT